MPVLSGTQEGTIWFEEPQAASRIEPHPHPGERLREELRDFAVEEGKEPPSSGDQCYIDPEGSED